MDEASRGHPLYPAHREWAQTVVAADPDEARALARGYAEHIASAASYQASIAAARLALLDELEAQGHH